jgi:hypothetical protein
MRFSVAGALAVGSALFANAACGAATTAPQEPPSSRESDAGVAPAAVSFDEMDEEDAGPSVDCGGHSCAPHFVPFQTAPLAACCPAGAPSRCGVDLTPVAKSTNLELGCTELEQPGRADRACPARGVGPVPPGTFLACRKPDGTCGVQVSMPNVIDFGCVDVAAIPVRSDAGTAAPTSSH